MKTINNTMSYFYKKILERVIDDKKYCKDLRQMFLKSAIDLDDAIYWVQFAQTLPEGENHIKYICDLANKGYSKDAIFKKMIKNYSNMLELTYKL